MVIVPSADPARVRARVVGVEAKGYGDRIRPEQTRMHAKLAALGVHVYIVDSLLEVTMLINLLAL